LQRLLGACRRLSGSCWEAAEQLLRTHAPIALVVLPGVHAHVVQQLVLAGTHGAGPAGGRQQESTCQVRICSRKAQLGRRCREGQVTGGAEGAGRAGMSGARSLSRAARSRRLLVGEQDGGAAHAEQRIGHHALLALSRVEACGAQPADAACHGPRAASVSHRSRTPARGCWAPCPVAAPLRRVCRTRKPEKRPTMRAGRRCRVQGSSQYVVISAGTNSALTLGRAINRFLISDRPKTPAAGQAGHGVGP